MIKIFKNLFKKPIINDEYLFKHLGEEISIRNGVGYGFISTSYLYDNNFFELSIGKVVSGCGDWGYGASYASEGAIKITIDKDCIIQKLEFGSYYNSNESNKAKTELAKSIIQKLEVGTKFLIDNEELKIKMERVFNHSPIRSYINFNDFDTEERPEESSKIRPSYYIFKEELDKLTNIGDKFITKYNDDTIVYVNLSTSMYKEIPSKNYHLGKYMFFENSDKQWFRKDGIIGLVISNYYTDSDEKVKALLQELEKIVANDK